MKILVLMKQVANKDAILRINKDSTWIEEADLSFEVNESDGYALEEALRIKEKVGSGEVIVCSMGPQRVKSVIKDALARGADRAIHVAGDNLAHLTPYAAATVLADAIRDEIPLPALLTIQSGISQIRYATLKGIMAAKKKEIKEVTPSAELVGRPSHQRVEKIYLPQKTKQTQMLGSGDAKAGAAELAQKLHVEARAF